MRDYWQEWQIRDAVTTAVNALGYGIWDLHLEDEAWILELTELVGEDAAWDLLSQLPMSGDYCGTGVHGSRFRLDTE